MKEPKDLFQSNVKAAAKKLLRKWWILAIFLGLALGVAMFYLKYASKTYWVESSILLRIEGGNNTFGGSHEILRAFNFMLQDKSFQNEIFFLQSYPLIRKVVDELDYRVAYYKQAPRIPARYTFSLKNIYKDSPFWVIPRNDHVQPLNLLYQVRIIDDEYFHISVAGEEVPLLNLETERIVAYLPEYQLKGIYKFGSQIETEAGSFSLVLNGNFRPGDRDEDFFFSFNHYGHLAFMFKGSLGIDAQGIESTVAVLRVRAENIQLGNDFLEKLIENYIESNLEEANTLANKTIEHIDRQLVDVSDDLNVSERQLQQLRTSHSVMNIEEKGQNIYAQLQAQRTLRDNAQRRLSRLEELSIYFEENKDSSKILAPSALGLEDPLLNNLILELTNLNSERQRIISQDQLRNPRLVTIEINIENLKNVISENLNYSINTAKREISALNTQVAGLNREFAGLPSTQRELLGIERRFNLNDATYTFLLERRIQAQILKASKLPDAKIIEPPRYAGVAGPRRMMLLVKAVFIGLFLPVGFFVGKDLIVNRINELEDVKMLTSVPVIATIPQNTHQQHNAIMHNPRSILAESFHILRSNLVYYLHGHTHKTILITSSVPGEGKSFTAVNLATSFALATSKTVLVEFDLRNPSKYSDVFRAKSNIGLSSYLINKASLDDIIVPTGINNFDIIHSGQLPPNPIELLYSFRTEALMAELNKMYDYIIIDTPPYGLLSDPFVLMKYADLTLFVTRAGYTKKSVFLHSIEDLEEKKVKPFYILMNDDKEDRKEYGKYKYIEKGPKSQGLLKRKIAIF